MNMTSKEEDFTSTDRSRNSYLNRFLPAKQYCILIEGRMPFRLTPGNPCDGISYVLPSLLPAIAPTHW